VRSVLEIILVTGTQGSGLPEVAS